MKNESRGRSKSRSACFCIAGLKKAKIILPLFFFFVDHSPDSMQNTKFSSLLHEEAHKEEEPFFSVSLICSFFSHDMTASLTHDDTLDDRCTCFPTGSTVRGRSVRADNERLTCDSRCQLQFYYRQLVQPQLYLVQFMRHHFGPCL